MRGYVPIEPLHLPLQLRIVEEVAKLAPALRQVLCFDTAFHRRMPEIAQRFPLPGSIDPLVKRYGYHGLSYEYVVSTVDWTRYQRVVIAHLGNGASLAAVRNGEPVDTTMGFTPLGGLMMGTRPGDLDPGVLLFLLRSGKFTVEKSGSAANGTVRLAGRFRRQCGHAREGCAARQRSGGGTSCAALRLHRREIHRRDGGCARWS